MIAVSPGTGLHSIPPGSHCILTHDRHVMAVITKDGRVHWSVADKLDEPGRSQLRQMIVDAQMRTPAAN